MPELTRRRSTEAREDRRLSNRVKGETKMMRRTAVVLIALLASSAAQSNYVTYQSWSDASEMSRAMYIAGAFDSLVTFIESEQALRNRVHYNNCMETSQMTILQLATNVLNFAKDKPELHTGSVQGALIEYLNATCGQPPTK
jgi:hypothetical protein